MGQLFHCHCKDCDTKFDVYQGGGFTFYQRSCDGCGDSISIPRYAPRPSRKPKTISSMFLRRSDMPGQPGCENAVLLADGSVSYPGTADEDVQRFTPEEIKQFLELKRWPRSGEVKSLAIKIHP